MDLKKAKIVSSLSESINRNKNRLRHFKEHKNSAQIVCHPCSVYTGNPETFLVFEPSGEQITELIKLIQKWINEEEKELEKY